MAIGGITVGCWTHDQEIVGSTPGQVVTTLTGECLQTGKPSQYITKNQNQFSLPSFGGW